MTGLSNLNLHNITCALKIRLSTNPLTHPDRLMRQLSCLIFKFFALLQSGPARLKIRRTRARHRLELSAMSGRELNDLGIGRGEIPALTTSSIRPVTRP